MAEYCPERHFSPERRRLAETHTDAAYDNGFAERYFATIETQKSLTLLDEHSNPAMQAFREHFLTNLCELLEDRDGIFVFIEPSSRNPESIVHRACLARRGDAVARMASIVLVHPYSAEVEGTVSSRFIQADTLFAERCLDAQRALNWKY